MKPETRTFYEQAVQRALERVVADLDRALDLEALARVAALSPFHFHRVFRGMTGETPLELHRRLRLERAAWSLLRADASVTAIALEAGYETHESFTRAFRAHYQRSPSEFRQEAAARPTCSGPPQLELTGRTGIHFQPTPVIPTGFVTRGGPAMKVETTQQPELRVATVRHVGPYQRIYEAFDKLGAIAAQARLLGPQAAMIAIYHDDPETTPAAELRSDAALVVAPGVELPEGLTELRLPAGRYARATHVGPYHLLGDTWSRLMGEWLPASGHRVGDGVCYELYRNTPGDAPAEKLVTELYVRLAA